MDEAEWLACTDPDAMLSFLRHSGKLSDRKARLFAAACCRRIWPLLPDERSRAAIEVSERVADGLADDAERRKAAAAAAEVLNVSGGAASRTLRTPALQAARQASGYAAMASASAVEAFTLPGNGDAAWAVAHTQGQRPFSGSPGELAEQKEQAGLLREILDNPFRPPLPIPASVLLWNEGLVRRLAEVAYAKPQLPMGQLDNARLAVLADAMEEAGADAEMVEHLRGPGPHTRGCWAVDLALGRE